MAQKEDRLIEHIRQTGEQLAALAVGSPEAIADCRRRQREAQEAAQRIVGTYQPSARSLEWAEHERTFLPDDVEGAPI